MVDRVYTEENSNAGTYNMKYTYSDFVACT